MDTPSAHNGKVYAGDEFLCDVLYSIGKRASNGEWKGVLIQQGAPANLISYERLELHMDDGRIAHFLVENGTDRGDWNIHINGFEPAPTS